MHSIELQEVTPEFEECWQAAREHLYSQVQGGIKSWLKADLRPPFLEHLSFLLGNQLFFIRLEDVEARLTAPGSRMGLLAIADGCKGHACIMPMERTLLGNWQPARSGWGLVDVRTAKPLHPIELASDELVEMTDWELQDFAVQIVRQHLEKRGFKLMTWNGNPAVHPSIWFVGDDGPEWIAVSASRHPYEPTVPPNLHEIFASLAHVAKKGNFAAVTLASMEDPFDPQAKENGNFTPLYRGHGVFVRFKGLEGLPTIN